MHGYLFVRWFVIPGCKRLLNHLEEVAVHPIF